MLLRASILSILAFTAACTGSNGEGSSGRTPPGPTVTASGSAPVPSGPNGVWKTARPHSQEADGCRQAWTCECAPAKPGCTVKKPNDTTTLGVCAADDGPLTGCTRCMALPPPDKCACQSVCP